MLEFHRMYDIWLQHPNDVGRPLAPVLRRRHCLGQCVACELAWTRAPAQRRTQCSASVGGWRIFTVAHVAIDTRPPEKWTVNPVRHVAEERMEPVKLDQRQEVQIPTPIGDHRD